MDDVGDGEATPVGGEITVGETTWTRVDAMGVDVRFEENETVPSPKFQLKNMTVNSDVDEMDLFELMLPVPISEMLECAKYQASEAGDKYGSHWYKEHIIGFCYVCSEVHCIRGVQIFGPRRTWESDLHQTSEGVFQKTDKDPWHYTKCGKLRHGKPA